MLDDLVPAMPGGFQGTAAAALASGPLRLEGARSLLRYKAYFRTEAVTSIDLLRMAYSLRYQVYCLERNFESPAHFPDRLETDQYDAQSVHGILFYRPSDKAIGTSRLILPNGAALPVHSVLGPSHSLTGSRWAGAKPAEISRFAISRAFRPDKGVHSRLPCLGLAQILLRLSRSHGVTHWVAMMEPALLRMLAAMGIEFTPIGPLVSYHGLRQPCGCKIARMLDTLRQRNPAHWHIVTDGGRLSQS